MTADQSVELTIKGDVHRLHLEPGDTVVVKLYDRGDHDTIERIARVVQLKFPDHKVLVLSPEVDIEVAGT